MHLICFCQVMNFTLAGEKKMNLRIQLCVLRTSVLVKIRVLRRERWRQRALRIKKSGSIEYLKRSGS